MDITAWRLLLTLDTAGAFYEFSPVLIPYNQPHPALISLLKQTGADSLVAEAGSLPLADVSKGVPGLRQIVWTVEKTSRHMDWNEVPEGIGGKIDVSVWHQLVQDQKSGGTELPQDNAAQKPGNLVFVWQEKPGASVEIVEFTQNVRIISLCSGNLANNVLRTWSRPLVHSSQLSQQRIA